MPLIDGRKTVAAAATSERLVAAGRAVYSVTLTAETDNTGSIVVGASTVVAALAMRRGIPLNAGESLTLIKADDGPDLDLSLIYLDVTVSGDGVTYMASVPT